jgi:hypothetical protein
MTTRTLQDEDQRTAGLTLEPVPATEIRVGDQHNSGPVVAVRRSQSGKTVYLTVTLPSGRDFEIKYSAQSRPYMYR